MKKCHLHWQAISSIVHTSEFFKGDGGSSEKTGAGVNATIMEALEKVIEEMNEMKEKMNASLQKQTIIEETFESFKTETNNVLYEIKEIMKAGLQKQIKIEENL